MTRRPGQPDDKADPFKGLFDSDLANQVKASAQQIWLAGMGAFARAQAEGEKVFENLVKEGASLQQKTQAAAEERFSDLGERMSGMASKASEWQAKAGQQFSEQFGNSFNKQWDKFESTFQQRTADALARLGVPTARDLEALNARLDAVEAKLAAAVSKAAPSARGPTRPPAAKKAALKKTSTTATAKRSSASSVKRAGLKRSPARKPSSG